MPLGELYWCAAAVHRNRPRHPIFLERCFEHCVDDSFDGVEVPSAVGVERVMQRAHPSRVLLKRVHAVRQQQCNHRAMT